MTPFLSERVFTAAGQPTAFVFVPFRLRGADGGLYYVVGELNIRHYMLTALQTVIGKDIGLLIADSEGDIYLIANVEHEQLSLMEHGNIFAAEAECHGLPRAPGASTTSGRRRPAGGWSTPSTARRGARCSTA